MIYPEGKSPKEVDEIILKIARKVAPSFRFGSHTNADMIQQAAMFACEALASGKYDSTRPLENFLYTSVINKLINFRRDKFRRTDTPCKLCYGYDDNFTGHSDGRYCEIFKVWHKRNVRKQNVLSPLDICSINDENESNVRVPSSVVEEAIEKESLALIDERLPVELRVTYLQMREGLSVPKIKRDEVERFILNILGETNV